jgi:putative spermidine/putrescine transport system ATP-binding protein
MAGNPSVAPAPGRSAVAAVTLEGVTKRFGDVVAVDAVDLEVRDGEFFSMLGPSGSGKTTTLRMIAGFELPTSGRILLHGEDVSARPPFERDVNTVFQDYALFPHMTVGQNVAYGLMVRKVPGNERKRRVDEILAMVRLEGYQTRRPNQLSGGQRQRVAIARAMAGQPKLVLADEPTANLDSVTAAKILDLLETLNARTRCTFIFATHDPALMSRAGRCIRMHDGALVNEPLLEARAS